MGSFQKIRKGMGRHVLGLSIGQFLGMTILAYVFCAIYDPFFYDYSLKPLIVRQVYSTALSLLFLYILTSIPRVGVVIYSLAVVFFTICAYTYRTFKYSMGFDLINAVFETNSDEASAFVNFSSILSVCTLILAGGIVFWLFRMLTRNHRMYLRKYGWKRLSFAYTCLAAVWYCAFLFPSVAIELRPSLHYTMADETLKHDVELFVPEHHHTLIEHWRWQYQNIGVLVDSLHEKFKTVDITESSVCNSRLTNEDPIVCVLIIGESLRADHIPAGGYERDTLPHTKDNSDITFFRNMFSHGTSTYVSIEGIMGALTEDKEKPRYSSFLSILKKHGFYNLWVAENTYNIVHSQYFNQLFGTGVSRTLELRGSIEAVSSDVLKAIDENPSPLKFVLIENGTGHFPYKHDPQVSPFKPANIDWEDAHARSNVTTEMFINDYDNCIACVDLLMQRLIEGLQNRNAVILYCSDHGQKLGEYGRFMHGGNTEDMDLRHVASWIWYSNAYKENNPQVVEKTARISDKILSQGQLYASILTLCHIESDIPLKVGDIWSDDITKHPNNLPESVKQGGEPAAAE